MPQVVLGVWALFCLTGWSTPSQAPATTAGLDHGLFYSHWHRRRGDVRRDRPGRSSRRRGRSAESSSWPSSVTPPTRSPTPSTTSRTTTTSEAATQAVNGVTLALSVILVLTLWLTRRDPRRRPAPAPTVPAAAVVASPLPRAVVTLFGRLTRGGSTAAMSARSTPSPTAAASPPAMEHSSSPLSAARACPAAETLGELRASLVVGREWRMDFGFAPGTGAGGFQRA